jgi:hypothetical protein
MNDSPISSLSTARLLKGDGSWPFVAYVLGDDLVLIHQKTTCFGGGDDPQDDGSTASGVSTKPIAVEGISLPMDMRGRKGSAAVHKALDGSPIPFMPFIETKVEITCGSIQFIAPLLDLGPAKYTGNAVDLTIACARKIVPTATARNFGVNVNIRIIGGAKYAPVI